MPSPSPLLALQRGHNMGIQVMRIFVDLAFLQLPGRNSSRWKRANLLLAVPLLRNYSGGTDFEGGTGAHGPCVVSAGVVEEKIGIQFLTSPQKW